MSLKVKSRARFLFGLILGPLVALYLIPFGDCLLAVFTGSNNCYSNITGFTWYGLPFMVITIAIVFPVILIALKFGWTKGFQYALSGAFSALILSVVLGMLADANWDPFAIAVLVALGSLAALIFWAIAIRCNIE